MLMAEPTTDLRDHPILIVCHRHSLRAGFMARITVSAHGDAARRGRQVVDVRGAVQPQSLSSGEEHRRCLSLPVPQSIRQYCRFRTGSRTFEICLTGGERFSMRTTADNEDERLWRMPWHHPARGTCDPPTPFAIFHRRAPESNPSSSRSSVVDAEAKTCAS